VLVSEHSPIPVYVQIARQITYLIYSRRLEDEAQLPTVRSLAQQLGVHPNTVAQAYGELRDAGLIETFRGRGTFVRPLAIVRDADWDQRRQLLQDEVARMRRRVHALGFTDEDIRTQLAGVAQAGVEVCRALFVAPNISAHKHAKLLSEGLAQYDVVVEPLEYEQLLERTEEAEASLADTYFLLTPVSLKQHVEELLTWHETQHRVLGITLELTEASARAISSLSSDQHVCVFTNERYLPITLNILHSYGAPPSAALNRVLDTSPREKILAAFEGAEVIVHTYGVGPLLDALQVPAHKRLLLDFRPNEDSLERLKDLFSQRMGSRSRSVA
jgi:DNA-binding transcriptional regulator YhcF (GntR family)